MVPLEIGRYVRTLFVTQWFHPEPVEVPNAIALGLHAAGHDVEVLTGIPNYPSGEVMAPHRWWLASRGIELGLRVIRAPLYPSHDRSAVRRMLNYLSWAASTSLLAVRSILRADACLVYSSPATAALGPAIWTRTLRTPFVLMIQDLWPDSVTSSGMVESPRLSAIVSKLLDVFVNWTYRRAAHIVVISPGMVDVLEKRGVARDKISVVFNWSANEDAPPGPPSGEARQALGIASDRFVATYAGNLGAAQGLHHLIDAAAVLSGDTRASGVQIAIAGSGVEESFLRERAASAGVSNVIFLGQLDQRDMAALRAASDVQVASLINDPLFAATIPGKVQSILGSGEPIIVAIPGDAARLISESDAGWVARAEDPQSLADAIISAAEAGSEILKAKGQNGRRLYDRSMSRDVGSAALSEILIKAAEHNYERAP